jgi:hypothetical protein
MCTDPWNIEMAHRHLNVEILTEAVQFPEKEYISGIFLGVHTAKYQCRCCRQKLATELLCSSHGFERPNYAFIKIQYKTMFPRHFPPANVGKIYAGWCSGL